MRLRIVLVTLGIVLQACLLQAAEPEDEAFQYAVSLMVKRNEVAEAAQKFTSFVRRYPTSPNAPKALSYLAYCYAQLKKDGSAADTYRRLVVEYPAADDSLREEAMAFGGDAYFRVQNFIKAEEMYSLLLTNFPRAKSAEAALYWRGECYARLAAAALQAGQADLSKNYYQKAGVDLASFRKQYPESELLASVLYSAGMIAFDQGKYDDAVRLLVTFVSTYPSDARVIDARYHIADSYYWKKDYAQAQRAYEAVLKQQPAGPLSGASASGIAWCEYANGRIAQAADRFVSAAAIFGNDPKAMQAHFDAGNAYREAGMPAKAQQQYEIVEKGDLSPMQAVALVRLGELAREEAHAATGDARRAHLSRAAQYLQLAVRHKMIGQNEPEAGVFLGEVLVDLGEYDQAANAFTAVVKGWPDHAYAPFALYHLSLSQAERKDYQAAADAIRVLLARFPQNRLRLQAAFAMAEYQAALGAHEKSRAAYEWLAEHGSAWASAFRTPEGTADPDLINKASELAAGSLFRLGELYYPNVDIDQATTYYQKLMTTYPKLPQASMAQLRLGEILEQKKQYPEAAAAYRKVIAVASHAESLNEQALRHAAYRLGVVQTLYAQSLVPGAAKQQALAEAFETLDAFIRKNADTAQFAKLVSQCCYYRAEVHYAQQKFAEARTDYAACYRADQEGEFADAALFGLGWSLRDLGNTADAREAFQRLVDHFPGSAYLSDTLFVLAILKREEKEYEAALGDVERILTAKKKSAFYGRAAVEKGRVLDAMGRHQEAVVALNAFIKSSADDPEIADALYALSWAWWNIAAPKIKSAEEAQQAYKAVLAGETLDALDPVRKEEAEQRKQEWEALRAEAMDAEDRMAAALKQIAKTYPNFPMRDAVCLRLGEVMYDRKQYADAIVQYQAALTAARGKPKSDIPDKAQYRIAWCQLRQSEILLDDSAADSLDESARKDFEHLALASFEQVAAQYPDSDLAPMSLFQAAELHQRLGEGVKSLPLYDQVAQHAKDDVLRRSALYGKGIALLDLKQNGTALGVFKSFLRTYPDGELWHESNWGAGQAALMLQAHADAAKFFNAAKENGYAGEAAAKARFGLGMIAVQRNDWETAREEFRKVDVFHGQWHEVAANALLEAARCSIQLSQPDRARKDLERILSQYPDTPVREQAQIMLDTLGQ